MTQDHERYEGDSPDEERLVFGQLALEMMRVQAKNTKASGGTGIVRALHADAALAVDNARLEVLPDLPSDLRVGYLQPGRSYPVTVRLSRASGMHHPGAAPDLYGIALRVAVSAQETHDLLMTNFPVSPARDAREFVALTKALAGVRSTTGRALAMFVKLPLAVGWSAANRMRANLQAATRRPVSSLALQEYWSRGAIRWGDTGPVRYLLRPVSGRPALPVATAGGRDRLRDELGARLAHGHISFELCVQRYVSDELTPVENTSVEWTEQASPSVAVATVVIPRQQLDTAEARLGARRVDQLAFNPWNTTEEFRPLGNLNRARKAVYDASSAHRLGYRFLSDEPPRNKIVGAVLDIAFRALNRVVPWHHLPAELSVLNLASIRRTLRRRNLIDPGPHEAPPQTRSPAPSIAEDVRAYRTLEGDFNDLSAPRMGAANTVFGRNMAPDYRPGLFDTPNPFDVSERLLKRDKFIPADGLNVLAAAWIQFQVHDWVGHHRDKAADNSFEVPLPPGVAWQNTPGGPDEHVMRIAEDIALPDLHGRPLLFKNKVTPWWDGSEVYGSDKVTATGLRTRNGSGAELALDEDGHLPTDENGAAITGFTDGWWLGLSALQTLFAREHNLLCAELRREYPHLSDEQLYQTARLVVSALIAKIHTLEWTPTILPTKAIDISVKSNWEGPPKQWLTQLGLWLSDAHALKGIPGSLPDHHGVPFSMTEEFVTVYRMHQLLPDSYVLVDHANGGILDTPQFREIQGRATEAKITKFGLTDTLYSLAIANAGAVTLHNFPNSLRTQERAGEMVDLAVVDIARTRRRGVPRYNDFRAALGERRLDSFTTFPADPETVKQLEGVYESVDEIDTMVGLLAENPPDKFGFSDTAFRIFVLMAARRLQSDRFLTVDFRPEIYTPLGFDWVRQNGMASVIGRHCPELTEFLPRDATPFAPWRVVEQRSGTGRATRA